MNRFAGDVDNAQGANSAILSQNVPNRYREQNSEVATPSRSAPEPGIESVGPAMIHLVEETHRAMAVQSQLILKAIPLLNNRLIVEKHAGQTDGAGNLDLVLYRVPQGFQFVTTRVTIEDATHNAGTPFSAAGAWIALISGDKFAAGSMRDMAPNPGNAGASPIIPFIFSDGSSEASIFRGGETVSLHVVGTATLANVDIFASLQGQLIPI
ncbi:MAG: hypothetical protein ACHQ1H_01250 [Nitrososphaerales archaeon]